MSRVNESYHISPPRMNPKGSFLFVYDNSFLSFAFALSLFGLWCLNSDVESHFSLLRTCSLSLSPVAAGRAYAQKKTGG